MLLALLPALMLLCGAHVAPSSEETARLVEQHSTAATQSAVLHDAPAHGSDHEGDHAHDDRGPDRHPHRGEPTCHLDGTHDEAGQISRLERPAAAAVGVVLSIDTVGVEPVLRPPPVGAQQTAPARRDCGRRHLVLAQISQI